MGSVTSTGTRPGREARKRTRAEKKKAMEEAQDLMVAEEAERQIGA